MDACRSPFLGGVLAFLLGVAFVMPAMASNASQTCMAHSQAALTALQRGDYAAARKDFSRQVAARLSAARIGQAWQAVQQMFGAYRGHGVAHGVQFHGSPVVVTRLQLALEPLDFVVGCDGANRITVFAFLKPSLVEPPAPIVAHTEANGVRVEPLGVPSAVGPLRGALMLPAGKGPFPAVVLVAGSGPNDLDETIGPNKPFLDIANGLAKVGVATLRYDKRTFDYPGKAAVNPDFNIDDEITRDALSALHLLARQKQVEPRRVFVLGHSLGAEMAPRIAQRDGKLAGVIMLAAPARPYLAVIAEQAREQGARNGESKAQVAQQMKAIAAERTLLDKANPHHPPQGRFGNYPQTYLLSLHDYDQVAVAKSLSVPMLILQGGRDFQVSPKNDFDAWKRALAGKSNVTFHVYPGLGHLFMPAGNTGTPADYAKPGHVGPQVIAEIANWIKAQPPAR